MKRAALVLILLFVAAGLLASWRRDLGAWITGTTGGTGSANPITRYLLPGQSRFAVAGRIEERLPAGSYVYLRLRDALGASHWIVTLGGGAAGIDRVEATVYARAESFHSKRLSRDFSPLWFGTVRAAAPAESPFNLGKKEVP